MTPTPTPKITYRQYGGKASIAKWIVSHFPEHRIYMEPCCASAAVLLAKPKSFIEIINDLDDRIMTMWQAIKSQPERLAALLWATPYATANWRSLPPPGDVEQAVLLMAEGVQFYCGNGNTSTWAIDKCNTPHKPKSSVWSDWFLRVLPAANRVRDVQLLHEDCLKAIERVYQKGTDTLIYIDPPYVGHEGEYRYRIDYPAMVELLRQANARVMVSESPAAAGYFADWNRIERDIRRSCGRDRRKEISNKTEVLFTNF
jgi:DNA adenine methylase